jgi:cytochrome c
MQSKWINPRLRIAVTILSSVLDARLAIGASNKDAERGREAFERRCAGCHALDKIKIGPPLRGVYGRNAGKDPRFTYSDAVKNTSVRWDETTLDRWLTDTESVVPGNDMAFRLNDPVDRTDIIAYLRKLSGK